MSKVEVDQVDPQSGTTLTLGTSGDTISIPAGVTLANSGTATGFASIAWQSTIVTGTTLSAVAGNGYWINTTSNVCTITLPSSASVGDELIFSDFTRTWQTNAVTINRNGHKYQGGTDDPVYDTEGQTVHIVYSGTAEGWIPISDDAVANEGDIPTYSADFLVVAGGGGGGFGFTGGYYAGGGGGGGYRNSFNNETSGRNSSSESSLSFKQGVTYTVTVGAAGAAGASNGLSGSNGGDSSISGTGITTVTSTGGGFGMGGNTSAGAAAGDGGSGGGAADGVNYTTATGGSGTANQGFDGGDASGNQGAGGGGASASAAHSSGISPEPGGAGLASSITGSSVTRAVGGDGADSSPATKTANTGDGGDGSTTNTVTPKAGATGVVILRMATANYSGTTTGSPTVTTSGSDTILTFTGSGSYTA